MLELIKGDGMSQTDCAYGGKKHLTFVHSLHFSNFTQNYLDRHHLFFNKMRSLPKTLFVIQNST